MKQFSKTRSGMTAIEVLVATMLAALMFGSVAGLTGALARQQRALRTGIETAHWQQQLADQLAWDLRNSRTCATSRNGIRLEGFAARDFATGRSSGRSARIDYYLVDSRAGRWLMRREQHPDELTNAATRSEIVCHDVGRIVWGTAVIDETAAMAVAVAPTSEAAAMPQRLAVQIFAPDAASPFFNHTFIR